MIGKNYVETSEIIEQKSDKKGMCFLDLKQAYFILDFTFCSVN